MEERDGYRVRISVRSGEAIYSLAAPPCPPGLKPRYNEEMRPQLMERFGYSTVMQVPKLEKVTLNMGVGEAKQDSKMLEAAQEQLATIAGQAKRPPRASRRQLQAARGHARRPVRDAARRATSSSTA